MPDNIHYIYYIAIHFDDGTQKNYKQVANSPANAVFNLMKTMDRETIRRIYVPIGIPKDKHERRKALAISKSLKAYHKKKREDRIVKYIGLERVIEDDTDE